VGALQPWATSCRSLPVDVALSGYGFGLMDFPVAAIAYGALGYFALQVAFSRWWLTQFRFGPLEWIWRSATYGQLAPIRAHRPPIVAAS
jgi:uncharacterized protein